MDNNNSKQISLPENIYYFYNFFEKSKEINNLNNQFKFHKKIHNITINIAKNVSSFNYYQIDIPITKVINPGYLIQYFKNIEYRNIFSCNSLSYKLINKKDNNNWSEEENYKGTKTQYNITSTKFQIIFYTSVTKFNTSISQAKYYNSYKILNDSNNYILRFELVLNNLDIDQDIDVNIYLNMIINILRAVYKKFKLPFDLDIKSDDKTIEDKVDDKVNNNNDNTK